jgi:hypothetical protein
VVVREEFEVFVQVLLEALGFNGDCKSSGLKRVGKEAAIRTGDEDTAKPLLLACDGHLSIREQGARRVLHDTCYGTRRYLTDAYKNEAKQERKKERAPRQTICEHDPPFGWQDCISGMIPACYLHYKANGVSGLRRFVYNSVNESDRVLTPRPLKAADCQSQSLP